MAQKSRVLTVPGLRPKERFIACRRHFSRKCRDVRRTNSVSTGLYETMSAGARRCCVSCVLWRSLIVGKRMAGMRIMIVSIAPLRIRCRSCTRAPVDLAYR